MRSQVHHFLFLVPHIFTRHLRVQGPFISTAPLDPEEAPVLSFPDPRLIGKGTWESPSASLSFSFFANAVVPLWLLHTVFAERRCLRDLVMEWTSQVWSILTLQATAGACDRNEARTGGLLYETLISETHNINITLIRESMTDEVRFYPSPVWWVNEFTGVS